VAFVEFPVFANATPLASGYMQAYAIQDPNLKAAFGFTKVSIPIDTVTSFDDTLKAMADLKADVYAFSCYVWNMKLVKRLVEQLAPSMPNAKFVYGGPQVMNQAEQYLSAERENMFLCNGEGEITFSDFLRASLAEKPDYSSVKGLSFASGGKLHTNEEMHRVADLTQIPSPFLAGVFDNPEGYHYIVWETNRGCPFKCSYCYWGGAVGAKVNKYTDERIEQELAWMAQSKAPFVTIVDANWGMLKRDVEITKRLVELRKETGAPKYVYFSSSKNTPDRNAQISKIFHDGKVLTSQSIALQTMNPDTLVAVERDNIKTSTYTTMQQQLNELGVPSFVEMIWPLPAETLESFKSGIGQLLELGADSVRVYNLLLMNNVGMNAKVEEFGLKTTEEDEPHSEGLVVTETKWVPHHEYKQGNQFYLAAFQLFMLGGLKNLANHLRTTNQCSFVDLFQSFSEFCNKADRSDPFIQVFDRLVEGKFARFSVYGEAAYTTLFEHREAFDALLAKFVQTQPWWSDPECQFVFELDLLGRPYIYSTTEFKPKAYEFTHARVTETDEGYVLRYDREYEACLEALIPGARGHRKLEIVHRDAAGHLRSASRDKKTRETRYLDCLNVTFYMRQIFPRFTFSAGVTGIPIAPEGARLGV
jgi:putative methyltransferase